MPRAGTSAICQLPSRAVRCSAQVATAHRGRRTQRSAGHNRLNTLIQTIPRGCARKTIWDSGVPHFEIVGAMLLRSAGGRWRSDHTRDILQQIFDGQGDSACLRVVCLMSAPRQALVLMADQWAGQQSTVASERPGCCRRSALEEGASHRQGMRRRGFCGGGWQREELSICVLDRIPRVRGHRPSCFYAIGRITTPHVCAVCDGD